MNRTRSAALLSFAAALVAAAPAPRLHRLESVIVKYRAGRRRAAQRARSPGPWPRRPGRRDPPLGAAVFAVDGDAAAAARALERSPLVAYAEPNKTLRTQAAPNDPLFGELYGMDQIDAPEGWDAAGLGSFPSTGGVKVGIVDTGIQSVAPGPGRQGRRLREVAGLLPIFSGTIQEGTCADDNGHGTHVAGTITANANNGVGVAGVAFNSPLSICKALGGPLGSGSTADVANCITWAARQGRQGDLDEPRRRRLDHAQERGRLRLERRRRRTAPC